MKGTPGETRRIRSLPTTSDRSFLLRHIARIATAPALAGALILLTAVPAAADGGPHVAAVNNGTSTLTADSCAGCHRAHTAQGEYLLRSASIEGLCLTCHGSAGAGATTDVTLGIQYRAASPVGGTGQDPTSSSAVAGALRSGGFLEARIGAGSDPLAANRPSRISFPRWDGTESRIQTWFSAKVPVLPAGMPATSAHVALDGATSVTSTGTVWGNGPLGTTGAGPIVRLDCTSCHNPHGNGSYRILNPVPNPTVVSGTFIGVANPGVQVTDATVPPVGEYRNYTVIDAAILGAVGADPTAGDYWRLYRPWDGVPTYAPGDPLADSHGIVPATGISGDQPAGTIGATWRGQMTAWCSACHTRYAAPRSASTTPSLDPIYTYRHQTNQTECTQCHVAHGSNAVMDGTTSAAFPYPVEPGGTAIVSPSSRLLKIDNRGTCTACHDPTDTVPYTGTVDNP
jgi:predicted CXXCH cytochrome family protein